MLKVAVIGCGYLGKFHAEKYQRNAQAKLIAVVDTNASRAAEVGSHTHAQPLTDYTSLLGKVDAVSIVVPTPLHYSITKDFLTHGTNVLLEKPMTTTLEEAQHLITLAHKHNLVLQIGHLERFNPAFQAVENIVANPLFIESHRLNSFQERGIEVDVILDIMIHDLDLILTLVKAEVKSIHAVGIPVLSQTIDIANARLEFENGCVVNITASRISDKGMRKIRIFQPDAYISIDFAGQKASVYRITKEEEGFPSIMCNELPIEPRDILQEEIDSFLTAVKERTPPIVSGEAAARSLKVALEIIHQLKAHTQRIGLQHYL